MPYDRRFRLAPQPKLRTVIGEDYRAMQGMFLGKAPGLGWVTDQLRVAEAATDET